MAYQPPWDKPREMQNVFTGPKDTRVHNSYPLDPRLQATIDPEFKLDIQIPKRCDHKRNNNLVVDLPSCCPTPINPCCKEKT